MAQRELDEIKHAADKLNREEKLELADFLLKRAGADKYPGKVVDLSRFYGMVKFAGDPVELQKRWRAEWD